MTDLMLRWLRSFLDLTFEVRIGRRASSSVHLIQNGIPQASVLSSLLFMVVIGDLPHQICSQIGLFEDDCAIWSDGLNQGSANCGPRANLDSK